MKNIDPKIILIDGENLARLMMENNVGVSVAQTLEIKRIDSDYFHDEEWIKSNGIDGKNNNILGKFVLWTQLL